MNIVLIFFSSFVLALSGALVPGPLFTITVSESLRKGFKAGPLIILGHGLLEMTIVILLFFKITPFLTGASARHGYQCCWRHCPDDHGRPSVQRCPKGPACAVKRRKAGRHAPGCFGHTREPSNPYWTIWWVTIGLGYLVSALRYGIPGIIAFFSGHISADLLWYSMISYAVSRGQKIMGERGYRYLLSACGIFLIFFGGWFLTGACK